MKNLNRSHYCIDDLFLWFCHKPKENNFDLFWDFSLNLCWQGFEIWPWDSIWYFSTVLCRCGEAKPAVFESCQRRRRNHGQTVAATVARRDINIIALQIHILQASNIDRLWTDNYGLTVTAMLHRELIITTIVY